MGFCMLQLLAGFATVSCVLAFVANEPDTSGPVLLVQAEQRWKSSGGAYDDQSLIAHASMSSGGGANNTYKKSLAACTACLQETQASWKDTSSVCSWTDAAIATRLWDVNTSLISSQSVVDTFQIGFAKEVVQLPGFNSYLGSPTALDLSFFANVFETLDEASDAQAAAKAFVNDPANGLKGKITPEIFTTGAVKFQLTSSGLCTQFTPSLAGKYVSVRHWVLKAAAPECATVHDIVRIFEAGFGPVIADAPGFLMYLGAVVAEGESEKTPMAFFLNIFETLEQAISANKQAVDFANGRRQFNGTRCGGLVSDIAKLADNGIQEGLLDFTFVSSSK